MTQPLRAGSSCVHRAGCCWLSAEEGTLSALLVSQLPTPSPSSPEDTKGKQTGRVSCSAGLVSFLNKQPASSLYSWHRTHLSVFWAFWKGNNRKVTHTHSRMPFTHFIRHLLCAWLTVKGTLQGAGGGKYMSGHSGRNGKSTVAYVTKELRECQEATDTPI